MKTSQKRAIYYAVRNRRHSNQLDFLTATPSRFEEFQKSKYKTKSGFIRALYKLEYSSFCAEKNIDHLYR